MSNGTNGLPDGGSLYYCEYHTLASDIKDEAVYAMKNYLDAPTDAVTVDQGSSCDLTNSDGDGQTDDVLEGEELPTDGTTYAVMGRTECHIWATKPKCDKYRVMFDRSSIGLVAANKGYPVHELALKVACHEIGHSVNLAHDLADAGGSDCMVSSNNPTVYANRSYNAHHKGQEHINGTF